MSNSTDAPTRRALISSQDANAVAAYLPGNYEVVETTEEGVIIEGRDNAGWTLEGYILPRLASGLYFGREIPVE